MAMTRAELLQNEGMSTRMGLKAPRLLTFLVSFVVMLAVLFAKYFGASVPGLTTDATQFAGLVIAYLILMLGCLLRWL